LFLYSVIQQGKNKSKTDQKLTLQNKGYVTDQYIPLLQSVLYGARLLHNYQVYSSPVKWLQIPWDPLA